MKGNALRLQVIKEKDNVSEDRVQGSTEDNAEASSVLDQALLCFITCICYIE